MIHILIVEDEKPISDLIRMSLKRAGYACDCAFDGVAALNALEQQSYDLILLDIMLPQIDGYSLMEYIRPMGIPVIFITAMNAVMDRVKGLRMGAEDYIVKPFEVLELLARVEVVLRRYNKTADLMEIGGLVIDTVAMTVLKDREEVKLTKKEYDLLLLFARNPNVALYHLRTGVERGISLRQQNRGSAHPAVAEKSGLGEVPEGREQGRLPIGGINEIPNEDTFVHGLDSGPCAGRWRYHADPDILSGFP